MHLVEIETEEENRALVQEARKVVGRTTDYLWIGLTDRAKEGTWRWNSGRDVTFTAWRSGEPNDAFGKEDCAMHYYKHDGKWNDFGCKLDRSVYVGAICEF